MGGNSSKSAFGAAIGTGPGGVVAYSSHYGSMGILQVFSMSCYAVPLVSPLTGPIAVVPPAVYSGFKWQCVEYARRWCG